jgi:copper chaperone CopZ
MTTLVIAVSGMHCGGCERRVREALEQLPGVVRAVPEHIGDEVEVSYDEAVIDPVRLCGAIEAAGFTVPPVP